MSISRKKNDVPRQPSLPTTPSAAPPMWMHGDHPPHDGRQTVTPHVAKEWLKANRHNRRVNRAQVERLKADLAAGRWVYDGAPVQFGRDHDLYNGQHRLLAISESGIPAELLIVTGLERAARRTIDTGWRRSPSQAFAMERGILVSRHTAARVSAAWDGLFAAGASSIKSAADFARAYDALAPHLEALDPIFAGHPGRSGRASIVAAFVVAHREAPDKVVEMARRFVSCEGLRAGEPALILHRMAASGGGAGSVARQTDFSRALNLVAAHIDDRKRSVPRTDQSVLARFRALYEEARAQ